LTKISTGFWTNPKILVESTRFLVALTAI